MHVLILNCLFLKGRLFSMPNEARPVQLVCLLGALLQSVLCETPDVGYCLLVFLSLFPSTC